MDEDFLVISDELWEQMWPLLLFKVSDPGATCRDNCLFMEAVLWRVRTDSSRCPADIAKGTARISSRDGVLIPYATSLSERFPYLTYE